ncbi:TonB-dependent siderophore receptor [Sphingomonas baiyangensis]|uniref:TonB-dependent siderophore receptor n=1 Tax=Sphingomonas baiyangensis TaxID=2572576 RepID=A0A4U1L8Z9_9SPHN|nr:TonB-dependent siderophore receptor [Sphingomonas baiyangensis]TKD53314.1 TonB-dependent siderophore receptor [Sphingomonas baiyangensis]
MVRHAVIVIALLPVPALGQTANPVAAVDEEQAQDIRVTGVRQPYRGDFAIAEIPQAIATIDSDALEANNLLRLTDALDLNASVSRQNSLGGLFDSFAVRGFTGDENIPTGYLVNGFNGGRGFGGPRDVAGIERIEVLKGPAAAVLGRGEPGGTINLVTKQAEIGRSFGTAALQYGSFDRLRTEADLNLAVSGSLSARLIGYSEDGGTFRDTVDLKRWGFLPSIGLAIGPDTRLTYDFEWTRVETPFDRGIVVLDGDFDTVPRDRYLGEPGDGDHIARATGHQLRVQHDFDAGWSLLAGASLRDTLLTGFSSDAELVRSRQELYVDGRSLSRQRRSRVYDSRQLVVRAELSGAFDTFGIRHRVLIGADHDSFSNDQQFGRFRPPVVSPTLANRAGYVLDILDPVYGRFPLPTPGPQNDRLDEQRSTGLFVQDQIDLTDRLQLRIGGRYDAVTLRTLNRLTGIDSVSERSRFSPQAGIVYRLSSPLMLYAAYGEGFRANVGTDVTGAIFDPETSRSIEAGAKLTALGGRVNATLAVFQLEKDNVLASDTGNPGFSVAIGKARSRGVELDLTARLPGDLDLLLSYAYLDAEARSTLLEPNFNFQIRPGDRLINIPDHNLNVQATKRLVVAGRRAQLGAGVQYFGDRSGETGTAFTLPSHTLARVFGDVEMVDGLTLFGSIQNLFDAHWYANSYHPLWVQPGAPRTATFGVRASF